jgi:hypothetical protein
MSEPEPHEDVVARSRRLRDAATQGQWDAEPDRYGRRSIVAHLGENHAVVIAKVEGECDSALIAATPTLLAELEAEVERLRGRVAEVEGERELILDFAEDWAINADHPPKGQFGIMSDGRKPGDHWHFAPTRREAVRKAAGLDREDNA